MAAGPNGSSQQQRNKLPINSSTNLSNVTPISVVNATTTDPREYYKTYDVMTGVRIAATLGGFFGLMVLLVIYKSKSKTEKALEDPNFTAAAVAEAEEEERQIQLALEATVYEQLTPRRQSRKSIDVFNGIGGIGGGGGHHSGRRSSRRFSSIGGYSSLLEPIVPNISRLPTFIDEDSPPQDDAASLYEDVYYNSHLDVPRRSSNITCSSSASSYLERRDSAITLGLPTFPVQKHKSYSRRKSSPVLETFDTEQQLINILVTQPTPGCSPCGSDRALYDKTLEPTCSRPKLAPLASISSCNSSLGFECQDADSLSYPGDTYPDDINEEENTENGVDPFDTDSDVNSDEGACYDKRSTFCIVSEKEMRPSASDENKRHSIDYSQNNEVVNATVNPIPKCPSATLFECSQLPRISLTDIHKLSVSSSKLEKKYSYTQETLF